MYTGIILCRAQRVNTQLFDKVSRGYLPEFKNQKETVQLKYAYRINTTRDSNFNPRPEQKKKNYVINIHVRSPMSTSQRRGVHPMIQRAWPESPG